MKFVITGSPSIQDKDKIVSKIHEGFTKAEETLGGGIDATVLTGRAKGVDSTVIEFCKDNDVDCVVLDPIHKLDKSIPFSAKYFFIRAKQLVDNADVVMAIWDGKSSETSYLCQYAKDQGVPVITLTI